MEQSLLTSAITHERKREWSKAVHYYEQYMKEAKELFDDKVYASYAKCLRAAGSISRAKSILMEGIELHSKSAQLHKELYHLYDVVGNWKAAKSVADTLVEIDPEHAEYFFMLGKAHSILLNQKEAKNAYVIGLQNRHGISFEQLIGKIQRGLPGHAEEFTSEYVFINGGNNFGAIIHTNGKRKYFTKITRYNRGGKREEAFYKNIRSKFSVLKESVPAYIHSTAIDRILYLTVEMIEVDTNSTEQLEDVISMSRKISTIQYEDIINDHPNPNYLFQMRNRPSAIVIFFTKIHESDYNKRMFDSLHKLIKQNRYPESIKKIIKRLETLIMSNRLYAFINPEKHYSLLHGDFIPKNMMIRKQDENLQVFDWSTFTTGPHFLDIARYLSSALIPYHKIKKIYLSNHETGGKLSLIEKTFFLYSLLLLYLLRVKENMADKYIEDYMLPVLNDLEICVSEIKELEISEMAQILVKEREEADRKIERLEVEVQSLKTKKKEVKKKFQNVINSKSWKITAPLREVATWGKHKRT